jgi:NAD(P)-dependent dehydrogenase (short-subunit alcohol dehydrogenase family)
MASMDFSGKRVLITGSTTGIGRGAAEMFHAAGARVAINGRSPDTVARTIREIGGDGLVAAPGDVATVQGCSHIVDAALSGLDGLDCLVNNVGISPLARMMDVTEAHWEEILGVNLRSAMFCTKAALASLRASRGSVVMIASMVGLIAGPPDGLVYAIGKAGLISMAKSMALELAPDGVRVNCICPGYINTPMVQAENRLTNGQLNRAIGEFTPLGRMGTVRECASAILYFASDDARFCTGSVLWNDGGCVANGSWGTNDQAINPPPPLTPQGPQQGARA